MPPHIATAGDRGARRPYRSSPTRTISTPANPRTVSNAYSTSARVSPVWFCSRITWLAASGARRSTSNLRPQTLRVNSKHLANISRWKANSASREHLRIDRPRRLDLNRAGLDRLGQLFRNYDREFRSVGNGRDALISKGLLYCGRRSGPVRPWDSHGQDGVGEPG